MVRRIARLADIAAGFDAVILDQWGVLHDGTTPYTGVPAALKNLQTTCRLAVLSNSGKRAAPNQDRISALGYEDVHFERVMTSGEAFFQDVASGWVPERSFFPVVARDGDFESWAKGLDVRRAANVETCDAILLMGLAEGSNGMSSSDWLNEAMQRHVPVYCTNPDHVSPRAGRAVQVSPGSLAAHHEAQGGRVCWYGKPHAPIYRSVETALGLHGRQLLMVGDSLKHDIHGAHAAGWSTVFVLSGIHAPAFTGADDPVAVIRHLCAQADIAPPDYFMEAVA